MNKISLLKTIKNAYNNGENIIGLLRGDNNATKEDILISYDFQAGQYTKLYYEKKQFYRDYALKVADYINGLPSSIRSIFEAGVGEGTSLAPITDTIMSTGRVLDYVGGCDISWSRIKMAKRFIKGEPKWENMKLDLFCGDMFSLPLFDNSVDLVITLQSLEPNGGNEEVLLKELYRVAAKYVMCIEPDYDLANNEGKRRMIKNGYIMNLKKHAENLGYNIVMYQPFEMDYNLLNPCSIMIIEKGIQSISEKKERNVKCCPITKTNLTLIGNAFFSQDSLIAYPIVNDVACLMPDCAIVATKMAEYS